LDLNTVNGKLVPGNNQESMEVVASSERVALPETQVLIAKRFVILLFCQLFSLEMQSISQLLIYSGIKDSAFP